MAGLGRTLFLLGTVLASTCGSILRTYPAREHPYQVTYEQEHYDHFNSVTRSPLRGDIPEERAFLTFTNNNAKINEGKVKEAPLLSYHYAPPVEVPIRPLPEITIRAKPSRFETALPAANIELHEHNGLPCFYYPTPAYTPVELPKAPELPALTLPEAPAPILIQPAPPKVWETLPEAPKLPPFTVLDVPNIETPCDATEIIQPAPLAPEPVEVFQLSPVPEAPQLPPVSISEIHYEAPNVDPCITRIYPASHFPCIIEERPQYQPLPVFRPEPAAPLAPIPAAPELPTLSIPEIPQRIVYAEPAEVPKEFAPLPCFDTVAEPLPAVPLAPQLPPLSLPEAPAQIYIEKVVPEPALMPLAPIPAPSELPILALPKPQEIKIEETFIPAEAPCFDEIEEPAQIYIEQVAQKPLPAIPAPPALPPLVLPEPQEIKIEETFVPAAVPCFDKIEEPAQIYIEEVYPKPLPAIPAPPALPPLVLPEPQEIKIEETFVPAAVPCFDKIEEPAQIYLEEVYPKPLPAIPAPPALPPLVLPEPQEIKIEETFVPAAVPCFDKIEEPAQIYLEEVYPKPLPAIPAPPALPPLVLPMPQEIKIEETFVPAAAPCFEEVVYEPVSKPLPEIPAPPALPPLVLPEPPEIKIEETFVPAAAPCFEEVVYEPVSKPLPPIPAPPALPPLVLPEPPEIKIEETFVPASAPCFEEVAYEPVSKPLSPIPAPPALPPLVLPEPPEIKIEETFVPASAPCFEEVAYEPVSKPLPPIPAPPALPPLTLPSPPSPIYIEEPKAPIVVEEVPVHITAPCEGKSISELPSFQAPYYQYFPAEAEAYGFPVITK